MKQHDNQQNMIDSMGRAIAQDDASIVPLLAWGQLLLNPPSSTAQREQWEKQARQLPWETMPLVPAIQMLTASPHQELIALAPIPWWNALPPDPAPDPFERRRSEECLDVLRQTNNTMLDLIITDTVVDRVLQKNDRILRENHANNVAKTWWAAWKTSFDAQTPVVWWVDPNEPLQDSLGNLTIKSLMQYPQSAWAQGLWEHIEKTIAWETPQQAASTVAALAHPLGHWSSQANLKALPALPRIVTKVLAASPDWSMVHPTNNASVSLSTAALIILSRIQEAHTSWGQAPYKNLLEEAIAGWTALPLERRVQEANIIITQATNVHVTDMVSSSISQSVNNVLDNQPEPVQHAMAKAWLAKVAPDQPLPHALLWMFYALEGPWSEPVLQDIANQTAKMFIFHCSPDKAKSIIKQWDSQNLADVHEELSDLCKIIQQTQELPTWKQWWLECAKEYFDLVDVMERKSPSMKEGHAQIKAGLEKMALTVEIFQHVEHQQKIFSTTTSKKM